MSSREGETDDPHGAWIHLRTLLPLRLRYMELTPRELDSSSFGAQDG